MKGSNKGSDEVAMSDRENASRHVILEAAVTAARELAAANLEYIALSNDISTSPDALAHARERLKAAELQVFACVSPSTRHEVLH